MNFPYLSVSDNVNSLQSADLITISNFRNAKASLKKKLKEGLGIEFLLHPARKMDAEDLSKWFAELREAYTFCESSGCQFILSSGARWPIEMISGRSFDEILTEVGIDYHKHWSDLDRWLTSILAKKVITK
jgi:RNase P/RNase MRP subunit p30